jgi:hypothetical protein
MSTSAPMAKNRIAIRPQSEAAPVCAAVSPQARRELIAQAAYFRAQHRGFAPGHEQEDWCAAEMEVDNALNIGINH